MGFLSNIGKGFVKVMDTATAAFVHPVKTVQAIISPEKTVAQVAEAHFAQPLGTQIKQTLLSTAGYATLVVGGAAVGGAAKAGTLAPKALAVAKTLIPTTLKGKVIAAVTAPIVVGAIMKEPAAVAKTIAKAPGELSQFGGDVATFATSPSLETAKQIIKESPVISGAIAAGVAIVGAKAILPAVVGAKQIEAVQEQTEAIREATAGGAITVTDKSGQMYATAPVTPTLPATEKLGAAKVSTARKKRSVKAPAQNISQRVNVVVANRASSTGIRQTHKYLNRELLIH